MTQAALSARVQHRRRSKTAGILEAVQSMLVLTCVSFFVLTFVLQPFRIPSASMEPTLLVGDFLLVDKFVESHSRLLPPATLRRGDIIVFHDPVDPTRHLIKRIVGLPGDRLRLRAGRVFLNGKPLAEPYAVHRRTPPDTYRDNFPNGPPLDPELDPRWRFQLQNLVDRGELPIPPGSFFVMGDNRNDSLDSRYWGFVPRATIVGRPWLIYLSLRLADIDPQSDSTELNASPQPRLPLSRFARWNRTLTLVR